MLGSFITVDEMGEWFPAGAKLLRALQAREYLDTVLVGHPGVTTMWLSAIGVLTTTLHWLPRQPVPTPYMLFVHVLDAQGRNVGQVDLPLVGPMAPSKVWQVGQTVTWRQPIPVPGAVSAGPYWLSLGVYDARTGERLPVDAQPDARAPGDGDNALIVGPLMIP